MVVSSIVPGSSAHLSGLIMVGDRIAGVDNEVIVGKTQKALREKVHGKPGTFVALDIERKVRRFLGTSPCIGLISSCIATRKPLYDYLSLYVKK